MVTGGRRLGERISALVVIACCGALLAACGAKPTNTAQSRTRTSEYFAESIWGVRASPRVSNLATNLPRGGGRDQTGRPYQVRGKWFHPREEPGYKRTGLASWYGDAFHGRLTANGEIYDQTHLTAAHPTMPLPSYARVTNLENGNSVIVRVNDRGPFVDGRIIDLSRRTAQLLETKGAGVARVEVEYLGRAPLHGRDDQFLMASFRPGGRGDPSDGLPTGVMIAMNGPTPTTAVQSSATVTPSSRPSAGVGGSATVQPASFPTLPAFGPLVPDRPIAAVGARLGPLAYAGSSSGSAAAVLDSFAHSELSQDRLIEAWQRRNADQAAAQAPAGEHVAAGTFADLGAAEELAAQLSSLGETRILPTNGGMASVVVVPDGRAGLDEILRGAWAMGAADALTVRD